jgi:hypothetical protein
METCCGVPVVPVTPEPPSYVYVVEASVTADPLLQSLTITDEGFETIPLPNAAYAIAVSRTSFVVPGAEPVVTP